MGLWTKGKCFLVNKPKSKSDGVPLKPVAFVESLFGLSSLQLLDKHI